MGKILSIFTRKKKTTNVLKSLALCISSPSMSISISDGIAADSYIVSGVTSSFSFNISYLKSDSFTVNLIFN